MSENEVEKAAQVLALSGELMNFFTKSSGTTESVFGSV